MLLITPTGQSTAADLLPARGSEEQSCAADPHAGSDGSTAQTRHACGKIFGPQPMSGFDGSTFLFGGIGEQRLIAGCERHTLSNSELETSRIVKAQVFLPS